MQDFYWFALILFTRPRLELVDGRLAADRSLGLGVVEIRHSPADTLIVAFHDMHVGLVMPDLLALYFDPGIMFQFLNDRLHALAVRAFLSKKAYE